MLLVKHHMNNRRKPRSLAQRLAAKSTLSEHNDIPQNTNDNNNAHNLRFDQAKNGRPTAESRKLEGICMFLGGDFCSSGCD